MIRRVSDHGPLHSPQTPRPQAALRLPRTRSPTTPRGPPRSMLRPTTQRRGRTACFRFWFCEFRRDHATDHHATDHHGETTSSHIDIHKSTLLSNKTVLARLLVDQLQRAPHSRQHVVQAELFCVCFEFVCFVFVFCVCFLCLFFVFVLSTPQLSKNHIPAQKSINILAQQ